MKNLPSTPESNGNHDSRGRFTTGNHAGLGNPHSKRVAEIRSLLLKTISNEDLQGVIQALVRRAKTGDVMAARELFDRCIGRPQQSVEVAAQVDQNVLPPRFMEFLDWLGGQE